ncbi:hypothetical protein D7D25_03735 [Proteiniphilum sp. X52]|nr:hypothetical protein D7D25_03735 [Proteiniphilum sp. X52]
MCLLFSVSCSRERDEGPYDQSVENGLDTRIRELEIRYNLAESENKALKAEARNRLMLTVGGFVLLLAVIPTIYFAKQRSIVNHLINQTVMDMRKVCYSIVLIFLFGFSCGNQERSSRDETYASTLQELREFIEKPDSLLTQNELVKRDKLFNLVLEKVAIKNNQFYSSATAKDFIDKGLSKYYYDILEKSLAETNQWVKDENITNLDSMAQSSMNFLFKKE